MKSKRIRDWLRNKARNKNKPKPSSDGRSGYIYVVQLGIENLYKIGRSTNVEQRLQALAAANPRVRAVVAKRVKDMFRCEGVLHRRYRKQRIARECYALEPENVSDIQAYLDRRSPFGVERVGR